MTDRAARTFLGFGFGPIQSALFLYEAWRTGRFGRFIVAEVDRKLVGAVRDAGGRCTINIAHPDRIEAVTLDGIELLDPNDPPQRRRLIEAAAEATEMATALPSVDFYDRGNEASVVGILAEALPRRARGHSAILYAAENHNHAAEVLTGHLQRRLGPEPRGQFQALNTVIGKMSGVIDDEPTRTRLGLVPLTPSTPRAVLVEAFNRILISKVTLPGFEPAIDVFQQKEDLLPFEEAKLYGHNAIHALIGYLAHQRGLSTMAEAAGHGDLMAIARAAFLDECGRALIQRHADLDDSLFTPAGFTAYAEDLLERMVNPHLNDLVDRVIRDPARKLGWDDRIYGTMRLVLEAGIQPLNLAHGAAAAVQCLVATPKSTAVPPGVCNRAELAQLLRQLWGGAADERADELIDLTWQAMQREQRERQFR